MKKLSKIVSVVLSLALCLGMASPAFAASFSELQGAINDTGNEKGTAIVDEDGKETGRYGYAAQTDEDGNFMGYGIEAWNGTRTENVYDENGDVTGTTEVETRNIQLKEDVEYDAKTDTYGNNNGGVNIVNRDITLDLNGHDMNLSPGAELNLEDGKFYEDGEALPAKNGNTSSVIRVANNGKLTLDDTSAAEGKSAGKITGGGTGIENGSTVVIKGGDISQNSTRGVWNRQDSTLIMEGGSVSENTGLGVFNQNGTFLMTDGDITGNCRGGNGAGVSNSGKFTMNGGTISDNTAANSGGAVNNSGTFTMNDGTISNNSANVGAGVYNKGTFNMNGGTISGNESNYSGGGVCNYKNFVMMGGTITDNSSKYTTNGALYNDPGANSTIPAGTVLSGKGGTVLEWEDGAPSVIVESKETTYYFDEGRTLNKSEREDGLVITVKKDGAKVVTATVPVEGAENVVVNSDGSVSGLPDGTVMTNKDSNKTDLPHGGQIGADGTYTVNPHTYTNQVTTKEATCTENGERADVCSCGDKTNVQTIPAKGHSYDDGVITKAATCTEDGEMTYTCSSCDDSYTEVIPAAGHTPDEAVHENEVAAQVGVEGSYDEAVYCSKCGTELTRRNVTTGPLDPPDTPDVPSVIIPDPDVPMADGSGADATTIEDQEVPLAGLMPVAQLLEELRQYEKIEEIELPEDFKWIDHEYAQAIYWGLQKELVVDTEEDPLDPDEVITVGLMREVLTNYVELCKGLDDFVITLEGEDDEFVMDLGERLTAFYGELEAALRAQEDKAA